MRAMFVPIGVGILLTWASANGVTSFGPLITWTIIIGSILCVLLLGWERDYD